MQATVVSVTTEICLILQFGEVPDYAPDEVSNQPVSEEPPKNPN